MVMTVLIPALTGAAINSIARGHYRHQLIMWAIAIGAAGVLRLGLSVGAATDRRPRLAGRRVRPAQHALRAVSAPRARLLRPPADRAADVAGHRRPPVGALLPRLRPDLHRPVDPHDRARRGGDVRPPARSGRAGAGARAVRRADREPLRQALAARAPGGSAADRRADRRRRGERLGRAGDQGVRAGGAPARAVPPFGSARVRPAAVRDQDPGPIHAADQLPAQPRAGADPADRRPRRDPRVTEHRRLHRLLRVPADADLADADARLHAERGPAGDRLGRPHLPGARSRSPDHRAGRCPAAARGSGSRFPA